MAQNKWWRSLAKFVPSILVVTAAIVDDANDSQTELHDQPDISGADSDVDGANGEMVMLEETEIIQIEQTSIQRLFTTEEWSLISKELE